MKYALPFNTLNLSLLSIILLIFGVFGYHYDTGLPRILMVLMGMILGGTAFFVAQLLFHFLLKWISKIPLALNALFLAMLFSLWFAKWMGFGIPDQLYYPAGIGLAILSILAIFSLKNKKQLHWSISLLGGISPFVALALIVGWFLKEGKDPYAADLRPVNVPENTVLLSGNGLSSPSAPGSFSVTNFTYGNGTDKHRPEYHEGVKFTTETVDASLILPDWKGKKKKWRERYWGFGVKKFPINGRVYSPEGKGPFPLVLIVHGNHGMIDYSDDGYGYLGNLLASRGMIAVSVDENFINGHWSGDFRGREMPARAWLLLKHLEQWNIWNKNEEHDFFGKVDMEQIMLVGHSRGGEAVSIAAAFNQLPYYQDNADLAFDFNFGIKGIVSIAPTDYRYHRQMNLQNINYLSLQGSYDADETSFWGMRPYHRLQFTDNQHWFKAGVYIHRANHGQFNSTWGRADFGPPGKWLLNTQPLLSGEDQREVAKVFISAFAEAALKNTPAYLSLFSNVNAGRDWLPESYFLTHFQDSQDTIVQDFEEDINLALGGNGISIKTQNLKIWREEKLGTRSSGSQENNTVILGWDYGSTINQDSLASYTLKMPDTSTFQLDSSAQVLISIAAASFKELEQLKKSSDKDNKEPKKGKSEKRKEPVLDFHVMLKDKSGNKASIQISSVKEIAPPLKVQFMKLKDYGRERIGKDWEIHLESFALPLSAFGQIESLELGQLSEIQLLFDVCPYGVIAIDEIGFSN